jgi:hypothetical protein
MERIRNLSAPKPKPKNMKWKALEYFIMGLTYDEASKLTGINKRTLERYGVDENWKDQRQAIQDKERQKIIADYLKNPVLPEAKPKVKTPKAKTMKPNEPEKPLKYELKHDGEFIKITDLGGTEPVKRNIEKILKNHNVKVSEHKIICIDTEGFHYGYFIDDEENQNGYFEQLTTQKNYKRAKELYKQHLEASE